MAQDQSQFEIAHHLRFNSYEQSEEFKKQYFKQLLALEETLVTVDDRVEYAECWLCGKADSVLVGFNEDDEIVTQKNLGLLMLAETN